MTVFIIDASVAAKWFNHEENHQLARSLLDPAIQLLAPDFFLLEMDNIFSKWVRRGLVTREAVYALREVLIRYPLEYHGTQSLREDAFTIAIQTHRSFYDCVYLALAVRLDARMITADRKLYEGIQAGSFARAVIWLGDLASAPA